MRKLFFLLVAIFATTCLWAHDFEVDGIYYNYLEGNNVKVTYKGSSYTSYTNEYSGAVTIPETVTNYGTTYSVTSIGDHAFDGCSSLTSVTIPNSVTSIGNYAFRFCSSLTSVTIPNSVTSIGDGAFSNCFSLPVENNLRYADTYLVEVVDETLSTYSIKEGTKWIGSSAFESCSSLTSVTIPNSVTSIGSSAFWYCFSLTSVTIGESVTSIGAWAFSDCSGLTSVTIPNSVTSIGYGAFSDCSGLTSVTIPNSVTSIESSAFRSCSRLTSITIPNSVTSIGDYTFQYCSGLTSVTIPNSVTSIGNYAFEGCSGLTSVVWNAENCTDFSSYSYAPFDDICSQITSFTFGDSVKHIPAWLCYGMNKLTSVTIPNSVTSIGYRAFYDCSGLTSVVWNAENCTDFSSYSYAPFDDICSQITSFTFGDSVKHIPAWL